MLSFDDLRGGFRDFYYTIEHCTAEWKPSAIPQIQYLKGFPGERLRDYQGSFNTYKEYSNYWLEFPNFAMEPLVSGNYILKIYEDNDPENMFLTRGFYVLDRKVSVDARVVRSSGVAERDKRQKVDFSIYHPNLQTQNPFEKKKKRLIR